MKLVCSFAEVNVKGNLRICTKCNAAKLEHDFYLCQGKLRSECKKCTVRKNVIYQRSVEIWKHRFVDPEQQKSYMIDYYSKHKEKFAEYRRKFREKYPDYYKNYARKRKNEKFVSKKLGSV